MEAGVREIPGGATPMPVMATVWERTWSVKVRVAVRVPVAVGMKATVRAQVECAASDVPQALTTVKSPVVMVALRRVSGTSPALVMVICCVGLAVLSCCCGKVREVGVRVSVAGELPMPVSCAVCVPAESVSESVPVRVPLAVGVKVMESVQPVEGARVAVQVLAEIAKSPVTVGVWRVAVLPPVLLTVMRPVRLPYVAETIDDGPSGCQATVREAFCGWGCWAAIDVAVIARVIVVRINRLARVLRGKRIPSFESTFWFKGTRCVRSGRDRQGRGRFIAWLRRLRLSERREG